MFKNGLSDLARENRDIKQRDNNNIDRVKTRKKKETNGKKNMTPRTQEIEEAEDEEDEEKVQKAKGRIRKAVG